MAIKSFANRYKIIKKLGMGSMAEVFLAQDTTLDRFVALKLIIPVVMDEKAKKRFPKETKSDLKLDHPNIVRVKSMDVWEEQYYITMDYILGSSLKQLIGRIEKEEIIEILTTVARTLGYFHDEKIVHQNIKPGNILVDKSDVPYITDFSMVKILGKKSSTKIGVTMETLVYMSPEQLKSNGEIDHRADIYSFGIMLYEVITGELPYSGTKEDVLIKIFEANPDFSKLPKDLVPICKKCIEKDPDKRYQSVVQIADDLEKISIKKSKLQTTTLPKNKLVFFCTLLNFFLSLLFFIALFFLISRYEKTIEKEKYEVKRLKEMARRKAKKAKQEVEKAKQEIIKMRKKHLSLMKKMFKRGTEFKSVDRKGFIKVYEHRKTGVKFVLVPGGSLMMGEREVKVNSFLMSQTEITQEVYMRCMAENPSFYKGQNFPVESVYWEDAKEFCTLFKLSLPTEAQWEYACRAGTAAKYFWGDKENNMDDYCWYSKNSKGRKFPEVKPVGLKKPNAFGLHDMLGNVWEWCEDYYDKTKNKKVVRGGSFKNPSTYNHCASRKEGNVSNNLGFRVVFNLSN